MRLRAPRNDGEVLAVPRLDEMAGLLADNRAAVAAAEAVNVQGRTLGDLRRWSRDECLRLAVEYTHKLTGTTVEVPTTGPWFVSGHQPALVHPGVWAKHFAIAALAEKHGGIGLNLVVDNDLLTATALSVPRGPRDEPFLERVSMLLPQPPQPWEEFDVEDVDLFEGFGEAVAGLIEADWGYRPLIADCWNDAVSARQSLPRLADCLTEVRRRQEERWGLRNLELPLSALEETAPFRWFAAHLLAQAEHFRTVHNDELRDYRQRHKVRSRSHPVPELVERDGWVESPFWIWRTGETQRGQLFVRQTGRLLELARDVEPVGALRLHPSADASDAVDDLAALSAGGWKLRTRALTTTLFARLCLADIFIHGIGGAKYDELTDRIIARVFGIDPPAFVILTATLQLPLQPFPVSAADEQKLRRQLRDLRFNPDHLILSAGGSIPRNSDLSSLLAEKQQLIKGMREDEGLFSRQSLRRRIEPLLMDHLDQLLSISLHKMHLLTNPPLTKPFLVPGEYSEYHRRRERLNEINADLAAQIPDCRPRLESQLATAREQLAANRVLLSREYAWCLFPEGQLKSLLDNIRHDAGL